MFQILQESAIPVTDKIFPWFVETALVRVEMEALRSSLVDSERTTLSLSYEMSRALKQGLEEPLSEIRESRNVAALLSLQLRQSADIKASIAQSGWRGLAAALEAISRQQNLAIVAGAIAAISGVLGGWMVWQWGSGSRVVWNHNQAVIEQCYKKFLPVKSNNDWFTCPGFQLPRSR